MSGNGEQVNGYDVVFGDETVSAPESDGGQQNEDGGE